MLTAENGSVLFNEDGDICADGLKHDEKDTVSKPNWTALPDLLLIFVPSGILLLSGSDNGIVTCNISTNCARQALPGESARSGCCCVLSCALKSTWPGSTRLVDVLNRFPIHSISWRILWRFVVSGIFRKNRVPDNLPLFD
jgi:hypothetical protein